MGGRYETSSHSWWNATHVLFNLLEWSPVRDRFDVGMYEDFDEQTEQDIINEVAALAEGPVPTASLHLTTRCPCWM
ncbi:hypothetical protein MycrhDRAFT_6345 [Mycolicibacterium rhodesiae JS60]|nr:hypothetical protein MycrhDRAFT_6345 [Mycolicibacterium rhodesiae JS60]